MSKYLEKAFEMVCEMHKMVVGSPVGVFGKTRSEIDAVFKNIVDLLDAESMCSGGSRLSVDGCPDGIECVRFYAVDRVLSAEDMKDIRWRYVLNVFSGVFYYRDFTGAVFYFVPDGVVLWGNVDHSINIKQSTNAGGVSSLVSFYREFGFGSGR